MFALVVGKGINAVFESMITSVSIVPELICAFTFRLLRRCSRLCSGSHRRWIVCVGGHSPVDRVAQVKPKPDSVLLSDVSSRRITITANGEMAFMEISGCRRRKVGYSCFDS